ncbi:Uncharacterized protein TCM_032169 [Theobroma cacao]|uniref:Uncharacterized protein n=1 Tax=Theobroma cacao TaxID=3641 RepID=A0A061F961_THECC|nr:Uncharacterized protein TCM_032169 [Theobroma cacao]
MWTVRRTRRRQGEKKEKKVRRKKETKVGKKEVKTARRRREGNGSKASEWVQLSRSWNFFKASMAFPSWRGRKGNYLYDGPLGSLPALEGHRSSSQP